MGKSKNVVVVGGGIAGILCAYLARKRGHKVTLVERGDALGGLLTSKQQFEPDMFFDHGTHFLKQTGYSELDDFLFSGLEVRSFDYLKAGSFYNGLYEKNSFLSHTYLTHNNDQEYLDKLINRDAEMSVKNLKDEFIRRFGEGYAKESLMSAAEKLFHTSPEILDKDAYVFFGLSRIIAGTPEQTVKLKKSELVNEVLAYHSFEEGMPALKSMYPNSGGVGAWVTHLHEKLVNLGVEILTNYEIDFVTSKKGEVTAIGNQEEEIQLDELVWTIPPIFLLLKLGVRPRFKAPERLTTVILDMVIDKDYLTDLYYFQCYDPRFRTFRVTLYNNYSRRSDGKYLLSVELLLKDIDEINFNLKDCILKELVEMKVINEATECLHSKSHVHPNSFPIPTPEFMGSTKGLRELIFDQVKNVSLFGKAEGRKWFMNEVLVDIFQRYQKS